MTKIKWFNLPIRSNNDCWVHALAYGLEQGYEEIKDMLSSLQYADGTLSSGLIGAVLRSRNFGILELDTDWTVLDCVRAFNSYDSKIILQLEGHVIYVNNNIIHSSNPNNDSYQHMLCAKVSVVYMKPKP